MNGKSIIFILLFALIIIFVIFISLSKLFHTGISIDYAKFMEEFLKSLVAVILIMLTSLLETLKAKNNLIKKSKGIKLILSKSLSSNCELLNSIINFSIIYFTDTPVNLVLSNNDNKKNFIKQINRLNNILVEQKLLIIGCGPEMAIPLNDYLTILEKLEATINNYLSCPREECMKVIKLETFNLLAFVNKYKSRK